MCIVYSNALSNPDEVMNEEEHIKYITNSKRYSKNNTRKFFISKRKRPIMLTRYYIFGL